MIYSVHDNVYLYYTTIIQGDIGNTARVFEVISSTKPHGILHVASYGMSGREMVEPSMSRALCTHITHSLTRR